MRHRVRKNLKFNNKSFQHRKAMLRNLVTSLVTHKSIKTTEKRAMIDKLINVANTKDEMNAIRQVMQYLYTKESSLELFQNIAPKYKGKKTSGFTRIVPIKYRDGDSAKLVQVELV